MSTTTINDKIAKLQAATDASQQDMQQTKAALDDSLERLNAAKNLLQQMDPQDQARIPINDTKLPELLELHAMAQEAHQTAQGRYETNQRYLTLYQTKLEEAAAATASGAGN